MFIAGGGVVVREEFDFLDGGRTLQPAELCDSSNRAIDQWRTDGTLAYGKKLVRSEAVVAQGELGSGPHLQACAVAIIPRRRGMQANLVFQFDFRNALQCLAENLR